MLITLTQHRHQRFQPQDNRAIAARQPVIDLVADDITPLATTLPIVIPAYYPYAPALPQALVNTDSAQDPFKGHTPTLWQDYPFTLMPQSLAVDDNGDPMTADALWADFQAPVWSEVEGKRLFDDQGAPSAYLQDVMRRLRTNQQAIAYTQQLVEVLRRAEACRPSEITHRHQVLKVYRVSTQGLGDRLETWDKGLAMDAMVLADRIEASQQGLAFKDLSGRLI